MQFKCEAGHLFHYPAKQVVPFGVRYVAGDAFYQSVVETSVCPICNSKVFSEYVEPSPDLLSIKQVDINEADALLAQGYILQQNSTTKAVLIKVKPKLVVEQPDPDCAEALIEAAGVTQQIAESTFSKKELQKEKKFIDNIIKQTLDVEETQP